MKFAGVALMVYCAVLTIMPLTYLHVEDLLPAASVLATDAYEKIDLLLFIHETLFKHLRNTSVYLYDSLDRFTGYVIAQISEKFRCGAEAMKPGMLYLALLIGILSYARRLFCQWGKLLPQTIFCYRLFVHSPPSLHSL